MEETVKKILTKGKGILAADESLGSIKKKFEGAGIEDSDHNRWAYRNMLFTAPGIEQYISGVIMFDETLRQQTAEGKAFGVYLEERGIVPGIKVDRGTINLAKFPDEKITEGIDGLADRLSEYVSLGAKFTKWRAVITIGDGIPTPACIDANAHLLARYAALAQEANLVPIVEPEVLMDGNHDIGECQTVTSIVLDSVFRELLKYKVDLKLMLLKPNMVISGKDSKLKASNEEIAEKTLDCFKRAIPKDVPGIVFLSGGQAPAEATTNLCFINKQKDLPWVMTFSYGRALQDEALNKWAGKDENIVAAQEVFLEVAKRNSEASLGVC